MNEEAEAAVEVSAVTVAYGRRTVVDGVSLRLAPGEVFALLGRNGAGKSSLVRCLLGHQKPRTGRVTVFGRDVWRHRTALMERVGVVPEVGDAPPAMSARALSRFCSRLYPRWDGRGLLARLERFEVPPEVPFGKLSKGQRSQVMLALALAPGPELVVLDDPTLGLDAVARKALFEELVSELADRGITVFLTSHDLPGIESIASRVALLRRGRLRFDEELETLKARFRRVRFGPAAGGEALRRLEPLAVRPRGRDVEAVVRRFDESAFAALAGGPGVERAEAQPLSLEEILIAVAEAEEEETP